MVSVLVRDKTSIDFWATLIVADQIKETVAAALNGSRALEAS